MYVVSYFSFLMSSVTRVILISFFLFSSEKEGREEERESGRKEEGREGGRDWGGRDSTTGLIQCVCRLLYVHVHQA